MSMMPGIDFVMDTEGESLTWKDVTRTYGDRGDASETYTEATIWALVVKSTNPLRRASLFADLQDTDLIIYTKTEIAKGDYIVWDSTDYRVLKFRDFDGVYAYHTRIELGTFPDVETDAKVWRESVLGRLAVPPGSPSDEDAYLVIATATGLWAGEEDTIAEWDNSNSLWKFTSPFDGMGLFVIDEDKVYVYADV